MSGVSMMKATPMARIELSGKARDFLEVAVAAAGRGDMDAVCAVAELKPEWVGTVGSHGRTMLWEAAYRGRVSVVEHLAGLGADIDAPGCHRVRHLIEISLSRLRFSLELDHRDSRLRQEYDIGAP